MKELLKTIFIALLTTASLTPLHGQNKAKLNGDEILRRSDANRNGWSSYSVMTTIMNYEDNDLKE